VTLSIAADRVRYATHTIEEAPAVKQRTLVKPWAREQMKADLGTTQQNLVALLRLLYRVHPKRSDGGDSVSAARDMEREELVFSFYQTREALITAVVIDTTTAETLRQPHKMPKHVEVWTSTTSPTDGFSRIAGARLQHRTAEQVIMLPPTRAKCVDKKLYTLYRPQWMAQCAGGIQ
jgi:hypothetical protein